MNICRVDYGDADHRHRRCRLHRLSRRRRAGRTRRRGARRRRPLEGQARERACRRDPARPRRPRAARRHRAARRAPSAIVHLAAQADVRVSVVDPGSRCVDQRRRHRERARGRAGVGARVVFASTGGAIYGECTRPAREDDPCLPLSPYGAAKLAARDTSARSRRLYGTPHLALRFGNVYGPRQDPHGEAGVSSRSSSGGCSTGSPCRIFGDGSQSRDYVYVGDVARATLAALDSARGRCAQRRHRDSHVGARALRRLPRPSGSDAEPVHEAERAG